MGAAIGSIKFCIILRFDKYHTMYLEIILTYIFNTEVIYFELMKYFTFSFIGEIRWVENNFEK